MLEGLKDTDVVAELTSLTIMKGDLETLVRIHNNAQPLEDMGIIYHIIQLACAREELDIDEIMKG